MNAYSIVDELGRRRALSCGSQAFEPLFPPPPDSEGLLLLGLGPQPFDPRPEGERNGDVLYLESPAFRAAMPEGWQESIPSGWKPVTPEQAVGLSTRRSVWRYRQNARLFNSFWGPLLARLTAVRLRPDVRETMDTRSILMPWREDALLVREVEQTLLAQGHTVHRLDAADLLPALAVRLKQERPLGLLSLNGLGLDPEGQVFRLAQACDLPVGIWMADNVWHTLSAWQQPWWREALLFVTDASFVPQLLACGARRVLPLPLGAWMPPPACPVDPAAFQPLVFVGRTSFPGRERFFSGLRLDPDIMAEAEELDPGSGSANFSWWHTRLGSPPLWPGKAVRQAGFGAETCSLARRVRWLNCGLAPGLTVVGDQAWATLLRRPGPGETLDLRPPVDYYGSLSAVYAGGRFSLNITSLLLPAALTQRHFDVWTAGGFLLTDPTPGLDLFPDELVRPIRVTRPEELAGTIDRLERDPALYSDLKQAWQTCLMRDHSLARRLENILHHFEINRKYA